MKRLIFLPLIAAGFLLSVAGCGDSPTPSAPSADRSVSADAPPPPAMKPTVKVAFGERVETQNFAITFMPPRDANAIYGPEADMDWYKLNAVIEPKTALTDIPVSAQDANGDAIEVLGLVEAPLAAGQTRSAEVTLKANGFKIETYFVISTYDDEQVYEWTFNK